VIIRLVWVKGLIRSSNEKRRSLPQSTAEQRQRLHPFRENQNDLLRVTRSTSLDGGMLAV